MAAPRSWSQDKIIEGSNGDQASHEGGSRYGSVRAEGLFDGLSVSRPVHMLAAGALVLSVVAVAAETPGGALAPVGEMVDRCLGAHRYAGAQDGQLPSDPVTGSPSQPCRRGRWLQSGAARRSSTTSLHSNRIVVDRRWQYGPEWMPPLAPQCVVLGVVDVVHEVKTLHEDGYGVHHAEHSHQRSTDAPGAFRENGGFSTRLGIRRSDLCSELHLILQGHLAAGVVLVAAMIS